MEKIKSGYVIPESAGTDKICLALFAGNEPHDSEKNLERRESNRIFPTPLPFVAIVIKDFRCKFGLTIQVWGCSGECY
jgi:hypothetical protein